MAEKPKLLDACREALRIPADCTDFDAEIEDLIEAAHCRMQTRKLALITLTNNFQSDVLVSVNHHLSQAT